jgi:hypothetical protein
LRVRTEDGITSSAPLFAAESIGRGGLIQQGFDSAKILAFGWLIYRGGGDDD